LLIFAGLATAGMLGMLGMLDGFDRPVRCVTASVHDDLDPARLAEGDPLGRRRFQRCPVGHHWSMVTQVDRTTAPAAELEAAAAVHDVRIPDAKAEVGAEFRRFGAICSA